MVRNTLALTLAFAATSAMAEGLVIKPKLTQSQLKLDAKNVGYEEDADDVDGNKLTVPGKGAGVDLEFALSDRSRLGVGLSYAEFERFNTKAFDTALGAYAAFDLVKQDNFSLYGKGGVSLHQFGQETFKPALLVNADLGAGASFAVASNVDLGAEYLFSKTLVSGDMAAKEDSAYKVRDVTQERSDYSLFVAYKF